jgi:hypothetical protein
MDFCSLQHIRDRRSTSRELCLPATFRLQGLSTLMTAFSLRSLAGFVSHRQRSWDSPFGAFPSRKVSRRLRLKAPTYRFSRDCTRHSSGMPASRAAVSGLLPLRESLAGQHEFKVPTAGCSHGLHPSRVIRRAPWPRFRPASSHALSTSRPKPAPQRLRVSVDARLAPPTRSGEPLTLGETTLLGFPHRHDPQHSNETPLGLWVHLTSRRALLPAADDP